MQREHVKPNTMRCKLCNTTAYPMAKGGYDKSYRPYKQLMEAGKVIDSVLDPADIPSLGVKYSCFDEVPEKT